MKPPAPAPEPRPPLANRLSQYFFRGLITFLPLAITVYVLVIFITWTERTAMQLLRPLTGEERARAKIEQGGLLVEGVAGPSARAGLAPGDVLLAINGQAVSSLDQVKAMLDRKPGSVALLIERRGARIFVPVNLG